MKTINPQSQEAHKLQAAGNQGQRKIFCKYTEKNKTQKQR